MKIVLSFTAIILVSVIETTNAIEETDSYIFVSPRDDYDLSNELDGQIDTLDSSTTPFEKRNSDWSSWTNKRAMEWKLRGGKRADLWKLRGGKRGPEWKLRGGKRWGEENLIHPEDKKLVDWKLRVGKKRSLLGGKRAPGNWMLRGGKRAPVSWMLRGGKRANGWTLNNDELNTIESKYPMTSREEQNGPFI